VAVFRDNIRAWSLTRELYQFETALERREAHNIPGDSVRPESSIRDSC
jgi:hypothetical protein